MSSVNHYDEVFYTNINSAGTGFSLLQNRPSIRADFPIASTPSLPSDPLNDLDGCQMFGSETDNFYGSWTVTAMSGICIAENELNSYATTVSGGIYPYATTGQECFNIGTDSNWLITTGVAPSWHFVYISYLGIPHVL